MATLRTLGALLAGIVAGSAVNMALVTIGPSVIPPPEGVDVTDMESIAESIHLFGTQHFVFPFLAHALGTLCGASVAFLAATRHAALVAYGVGALSFAGGVAASRMIPAPAGFVILDLTLAYFPMAWLGIRLGTASKQRRRASA